jgi:CheY-like chemotaxis protein
MASVDTKVSRNVILYAEDDLDDFESAKEIVDQLSDRYVLINAKNGAEAVAYLEQHRSNLPCMVILDLNMPVMSGKEVLLWIKEQEAYDHVPIMVFTTSSREEDIRLCQMHDCTFFRKPTLYRDLLHIMQTMLHKCAQS